LSGTDSQLLSPLRYPGSKRRLVKFIEQTLEINQFKPNLYIEPFIGGGSVALRLLQNDLIEKAILMDLDPWVASFWRTVFFDSEWLIERIYTAKVTLDNWQAIKQNKPRTIREQAWNCFFLNRTSFSGILEKKAGPLGGQEQSSEYKIDCRFPKETLIERIQKIAKHKDKILGIWCVSWENGIARVQNKQREGKIDKGTLFYYFDPPFFEKADALYRYYFSSKDHENLRDVLLALDDKWILSYDSAERVEALYGSAIRLKTNGTKKHHVELLYSVSVMQKRQKGKEIILSNFEHLPSVDDLN